MEWLRDDEIVSEFLKTHNIPHLLKQTDGLLHVKDFFPPEIADAILASFLKMKKWDIATGEDDSSYSDQIPHRFNLTELYEGEDEDDDDDTLLLAGRVFWKIWEKWLPNFTLATYKKNDFIAPHDDDVLETYSVEEVEEIVEGYGGNNTDINAITKNDQKPSKQRKKGENEIDYNRKIAMVYYLNKDWKNEFGGQFVDLNEIDEDGEGKEFQPEFNSVVFFEVPRMHCVVPVRGKTRVRRSFFGWWLEASDE